MVKATPRKSTKVADKRRVARPGSRLVSYANKVREAADKKSASKSGQPTPKPKLDIGKASVAGMGKAALAANKVKKVKDARVALVVGTPSKPAPTKDIATFMRKVKAVDRTRKPGMATAFKGLHRPIAGGPAAHFDEVLAKIKKVKPRKKPGPVPTGVPKVRKKK